MPPLKPLQIMPVPPPTAPSSTAPAARAIQRVEHVLRLDVKAVDVVEPAVPGFGDHRQRPPRAGGVRRPWATRQAITASRTTPTLWVLVISTGPSRKPDSSTQVVPVISPLPF